MYVLGIETSCDETAAAIVKDGRGILSSIVSSSLKFHKKYGGVIPEIASRMQLETIAEVADCAVKKAAITLKKIGLISVTDGPGLLGSLLVGISFAKAVSLAKQIPLLGINHLYSHIYASFLSEKKIKLPFIALVVSGGHTSLFYVESFTKIKPMGATLDDAAGEAFDKVAKLLGLGYPGGPLIEKLSSKGDPKKIKFNCSDTDKPLDFSFSGIKTAVLYLARLRKLTLKEQASICASFQEAVIDTLIKKSLLACKLKKINSLVIGGGVARNKRLREEFFKQAEDKKIKVYFPHPGFCLDNAAMVAGLGYRLFRRGYRSDLYLSADLN